MKEIIQNAEILLNQLYGEEIIREMKLKNYVDSLDISDREPIIDRESEIKDVKVEGINQEDILERIDEIEQELMGLISVETKYLLLEEVLEVNEMVFEIDKYKNYHRLAQKISDELEKEKHIYCYDFQLQKYEPLIFDEDKYDKLKNLNIIKKQDSNGWSYTLFYLNEDLQLRPLDRFVFDVDDWENICINRNGNILDIRKENYEIIKHPLLRKEYLEEVEAAKKVSGWLKDNYGGDEGKEKLEKEIMQEAEKKAKEIEELLEVAEEIIGEENIDNGDE